ncbi:putative chromosome segregation protein [Phaeomoniella chlamydospora]|uniref:Putative chromosome segregation protein n=1 Tax=Phaeomoniella chlamydospora TaxID=158046 RepID=A0A0G2F3L1_PHACM|nr:putative chromosome segregation protein [Phaeomoniella chlamydospora]
MPEKPPFRARPAQPPGPTFLSYSPDGEKLLVSGSANFVRCFKTGDAGEPDIFNDTQEDSAGIIAGDDFWISASEDGTVCKYSMSDGSLDKMLVRCALPIRDIALSPDGNWCAVASDELLVKVVNVHDMEKIVFLREQQKPVKHVSFDPTGRYLAASCTDGVIYIYSMSSMEPKLFRKIDGVIQRLETDSISSSACVWHPDGRAFAAATAARDIVIISVEDGEKQKSFKSGHLGDITAMVWSQNGALLASAGRDDRLVIWETKTQQPIKRNDYEKITQLTWHPKSQNIFNWSNTEGEIFIIPGFLQEEDHVRLLEGPKELAPFYHDPLKEVSGNARRTLTNGLPKPVQRLGTPDSLDDLLSGDENGWIEDDDGAGYAEAINGNGKRIYSHFNDVNGHDGKRSRYEYQPTVHQAFQPGSTPWRGNRKYLCLNLIGFVWTVDQETHHTVTVEFYDREMHRDFHFTDPYLYDKACLNEKGTLFSSKSTEQNPAMIFYRPHETWTNRADWRTELPRGEDVTAISLSDNFVVVTTSANYVRVYTLFGTPFRIYRQKSSPAVTCAAFGDYVMTIGNGPVGGNGSSQLTYSIENIKRDETHQNEDIVALPENVTLGNVFFSDQGDPYIYDSDGVLSVLLHWRSPNAAKWVPVLDTRLLDRLASGRKEERYWPVAVANERFHCIILKGGDKYPYFPRPLLSEFEFRMPLVSPPLKHEQKKKKQNSSADEDDDQEDEETLLNPTQRLESSYLLLSVQSSLLSDVLSHHSSSTHIRSTLHHTNLEHDKTLLQLIAQECLASEESGMKAFEIVKLMKDRSGKMLEACAKVARRYERWGLEERIRELAERRIRGDDGDEEEEGME